MKESRGWELVFTTPLLERPPHKIAVNAKVIGNVLGDKMLAYSTGTYVHVARHFKRRNFQCMLYGPYL